MRSASGSGNPELRGGYNEAWPFLSGDVPPPVAALQHLALIALWELESFLPCGSATY